MKKILFVLSGLFLISTWAFTQSQFSDVKMKTLENGLTIAVKEVHEAPLAQIQLTYKVGFRDAPEGRLEMPHFVEHILFKGTPQFPRDKFPLLVTENGGYLNGFTSAERTTYVETVPSHQVQQILEMEASRMTEVAFDPQDVQTEKNVVLSEVRGYAGAQTNQFNKDLFTKLGSKTRDYYDFEPRMKGIQDTTVEEAKAFYKKYYRPDNAVLVVVGDVKAEEVFTWAQQYFGKIPRPAQALVKTILPFSPLTQDLRVDGKGIVREPFGFRYFNFIPYSPKNRDFIILFFIRHAGIIPELTFETSAEGGFLIQRFNNPAPSPLEVLDWNILAQNFSNAKTALLEQRKLGWDEIGQLAGIITDGIIDKNDPAYEDWLTKEFSTVEYFEVKAFAEKYLGKGPNLVAEFKLVSANEQNTNYNASETTDNFSQIQDVAFLEERSGSGSDYYKNLSDKAYSTLRPKLQELLDSVKIITLDNGLKLYLRQSNLSAKTWVNLLVPAGTYREKIPFTAARVSDLVFTGGPQIRLKRELQSKGVSFSNASVWDSHAAASASGPGTQLKNILKNFAQALGKRTFNPSVLNAEIEKNLNNLKSPTKDMGYWITENIKALFKLAGLKSYDPEDATAPMRAQLSIPDLQSFYEANYRPEGSILIITGPQPLEVMESWARETLGRWEAPSVPAFPSQELSSFGKVDQEVQKFALVDKSRENIVHFFQSLAPKDYPREREVQFDLGSSILGEAFTGRLFRNLRVKQGLTYGTSVWNYTDRIRSSLLSGYLQASPENLDKAISAWKNELKTMQNEGPTPVEFYFAKNKMLNARAFSFRNTESIHSYMVSSAIQNVSIFNALDVFTLIHDAKLEDMITIWKEDLDVNKFLISIAGPGRSPQ